MEFFDSLIGEVNLLKEKLSSKQLSYNAEKSRKDIGYSQVILQRDTAFELGGTGFNLVTSSSVEDGIVVAGPDLDSIKGDCSFARISVVQIENQQDEQKAYNLIKKIEYVKYHYFPDGYMIRTSSRSHKEAVRVSRSALKEGLSFESIGNLLISSYKKIPGVKGVKVIFITDPTADFAALENIAKKGSSIAETLNHIMNSVKFDCDSCNLKAVCDEVEGMKELHFKMQQ